MTLTSLILSDHLGSDYEVAFDKTTVVALVRYYG